MSRLILIRILAAIPTLFFILAFSFLLMRVAPGGPFDLERPLDPAAISNLRRVYDLDAPLWRQFLHYLAALSSGDFGPSFAWRDFSVSELFAKALPISAALGAAALILALPVGAFLGLACAASAGSMFDVMVGAIVSLGVITPSFVVAPMAQLVFGLWLRWLPIGGGGDFKHYILPILVLATPQVAAVARLTRSAAMEALAAPYQLTALAYGLPKQVRLARAFRVALLPLISHLAPAAAGVMTGSVVVETLFGLPGVGRYFVESALDRDYTVALAAVLLAAGAVVIFNLLADLAYLAVDPRVQL